MTGGSDLSRHSFYRVFKGQRKRDESSQEILEKRARRLALVLPAKPSRLEPSDALAAAVHRTVSEFGPGFYAVARIASRLS